jgi:hypothetical protein
MKIGKCRAYVETNFETSNTSLIDKKNVRKY